MPYDIKEPNAPATKRQLWALFCATKEDFRDKGLTRKQASDLIDQFKRKANYTAAAPKSDQTRDAMFQAVWDKAMKAGLDAGKAIVSTPMVVQQRANPFDDTSPVIAEYAPVMDGLCGFAWITVKPGTCAFAKWLKSKNYARPDSYYGGVMIWISNHNQSHTRKCAHAAAMCKVLLENKDIIGTDRIYTGERLD